MENLKLFFLLYARPATAMSEILDRGGWFAAAVAVLIVAGAFYATINTKLDEAYRIPAFHEYYQPDLNHGEEDGAAARAEYERALAGYDSAMSARKTIPLVGDRFFSFFSFEPTAFYQPLLSLSLFYVPAVILLMSTLGGLGSFGLVIRRDYGSLAICSLMAWAAAHLPFAIAGIVMYSQLVDASVYLAMWAASSLLFGLFMVFAIRTVFGANYGSAILVVCIAWLAFSLGMYVFRYVSPWLLSPFLLFWAFIYFGGYLGGEVRGFGNALRQKQNFKRFLHNATVNPRDADAHVQLALIYIQRRQEAKALEHLRKAIDIDENEIDANYELGKIARAKGDLQVALDHFARVVEQNDKYALSEIWREIGETYFAAGMLTEAHETLSKYVARRPVDPEGLYYLGKVLKAQGNSEKAREMFEEAIKSVKGSPDFRRRDVKRWSKLAEKEI